MSGTPDLAQFQALMRTIELACSSIQMHINPAEAEATILSLSQSPRPYQACQFILENSQMANARFQAAAAIRNAAIREWVFLTADEKRGLISFCLSFMMQHASSPEGYVQGKVSSVAAQLLKRGWVDFTAAEKESLLYQVNQAITGCHGLDVQYRGINFLESLVSEFLPSTSTAMGLPREFHEQCHGSFEQDYLKNIYCWARDAAFGVTNKIMESASTVPEVNVCTAAMRLMLQILNWDFRYSSNGNKTSKSGIDVFSSEIRYDIARRSDCVLVQPGPSWRKILVTNSHVGWVLSLYGVLRQKFSYEGYWLDCPIAVSARKLIVQLCSLTGAVFPNDNEQMREQHLLQLLSGIVQWISPPDAVSKAIECGKSESEMLDGCRALLAIATVTTPSVFDRLLKAVSSVGTITLLSSLMCEVLKVLMTNYTDEETWSWVARDILLDTWTSLLVPMDNTGHSSQLPVEGINAAANLFAMIVESELKAASASVNDEECEAQYMQASISAMDERLSSYALIARAAIEYTIPLLTRSFSDRLARLHQRGASDPTETLEELYSLLLITGHVLADGGEGEVPLVPKAIQLNFKDAVEIENHPVILLSCSIIKFAEQSLDPEMRASIFSPRLMEAIIWFIARWSRTYLMPDKESKRNKTTSDSDLGKAWLNYFKENFQGKYVLDIIIRISQMTLVSYPGEKDLQALTCFHLLNGMVRTKSICQHIVTLDSWRDLAKAFALERTLFTLHGSHQRSLAQALTLSASSMSSEASNQYVKELMSPMVASLLELSNKKDLKNVAQQPDIILFVCIDLVKNKKQNIWVTCLLERLRGAASADEPRIQKAIYEMGISVMHPVQIFLEVYKNESAVVYLLLKFVVEWVDGQIIYLEAQETASVVNFCMGLLQLYSSHNIGKISVNLSNNLLSEAETEKYRDLRALLQLLSSLCSKDLVDFSSNSSETQGPNISQVVFFGLHIVTPLITSDLLKYPKLSHDYFSLLSHMLEVYPEMVAQLDSNAFGHVLGTLDFGLHHQDTEVVDMCLRSLKALASYHYKEIVGGRIGLGSQATSYNDTNGRLQDGILSRFLRLLLQFLLFEDYSTDLTSAAADALLPLILCEQGLYQRLGNELLEKQGNPTFKSRLANALHSLTSANNLSSTLDRANYQRFRKNLNEFLVEVRGFLRTM